MQRGAQASCSSQLDQGIILPRELGEKIHDTDATLLYFQRQLCEYVRDTKDGKSQWIILDPVVLRESEDEEFDGDEEDEN